MSAVKDVMAGAAAAEEYSRRSPEEKGHRASRRNNTGPRCEDGRRRVGRGAHALRKNHSWRGLPR